MALFALLCLCTLFRVDAGADGIPIEAWMLDNFIPADTEIPPAVIDFPLQDGNVQLWQEQQTVSGEIFETVFPLTGYSVESELIIQTVPGEHVVPEDDGVSSEELLDAYICGLLGDSYTGGGEQLLFRTSINTGYRLGGMNTTLYSQLRSQVEQVSSGSLLFTKFSVPLSNICQVRWTIDELGLGPLVTTDESGQLVYTDDAYTAVAAVSEAMQFNLSLILSALLADCPYDLYWFDKTEGIYGGGYRLAVAPAYIRVVGVEERDNLCFSFAVAQDYSSGEYSTVSYEDDAGNVQTVSLLLTVDNSCIAPVEAAVVNAQAIIARYAGLSDQEKLRAYAEEICALAAYNGAPGSEYGDPWQLIWVFDGDDSTSVVCEGYAKAFQYLCDHSSFQNNIVCYTVTGRFGPIGHMWNIVHMDDGLNYLVDLTNADAGSTMTGDLFLVGHRGGSVEEGYYAGVNQSYYVYSNSTRYIYTVEELTLAPHDYGWVPPHEHIAGAVTRENQHTATCTEEGSYDEVIYCSICGEELSRITIAIPVTEHIAGEPSRENEVPATCSTEGSYDEIICCSVCGREMSRVTVTVSKTPHNPGEPYRDGLVEASYTEDGGYDEVIRCTVCGEELQRNAVIIPKLTVPPPVIRDITEVSGGLRIRWMAIDEATEFLIYRRIAGTEAWSFLSGTANLYFTDLDGEGGITYEYVVVTLVDEEHSDYSNVKSERFPVKSEPDPVPKPAEASGSPSTGDHAHVARWILLLFGSWVAMSVCLLNTAKSCKSGKIRKD